MQTQSEAAIRRLPLVPQLARFGVIGACTAPLDFGFLYVLVNVVHLNYLLSALVAITTASTLNYLLSAQYVFLVGRFARSPEFTIFMLTSGAGLALNQFTMWALVGLVGVNYSSRKCARKQHTA